MKQETLPDGTVYTQYSPMKGVPLYGDWLRILLDRGAATLVREVDRREGSKTFGELVEKIVPHDASQGQRTIVDNDNLTWNGKEFAPAIRVICIGCGAPTPQMEMARIVIGGIIQLAKDDRITRYELERRYRMQPVSKAGLGCKECVAKFNDAQIIVDRDNQARGEVARIQGLLEHNRRQLEILQSAAGAPTTARVRCLHGLPDVRFCAVCNRRSSCGTVDTPVVRAAYIDVFAEDS